MSGASLLGDADARRRAAAAVTEARRLRDVGMASAETAGDADIDRHLIDVAIDSFAATGARFSANDVREVLPDVRPALLGARFAAATTQQRIRWRGYTPSTKASTRGKPVNVYQGMTVAAGADR